MSSDAVREAALAAAVAGLVSAALASLSALVNGSWPFSPTYFLLCALLGGLGGGVIGLLGGLGGRRFGHGIASALALYVFATGLLAHRAWEWELTGSVPLVREAFLPALAVGLALYVSSVRGSKQDRRRPWDAAALGAVVAVAQLGMTRLYPRAARELAWLAPRSSTWGELLFAASLFLAVLALAAMVPVRRRGWSPAPLLKLRVGLRRGLRFGLELAILYALIYPWPQTRQALTLGSVPAPAEATPGPSRPHLLLIVLDTVRADVLSLYGHPQPTTPQLEAFLADRPGAIVFPHAYAPSSWTVPTHATLLTGLPPSAHGAHWPLRKPDRDTAPTARPALNPRVRTLAEALAGVGYRSVGISANPQVLWTPGMRRGFELFYQPTPVRALPTLGEHLRRLLLPGLFPEALTGHPTAGEIFREAGRHLEDCGESPCFVLANVFEPHALYTPPASCRGRFAPWSPWERILHPRIDLPPARLQRLAIRYAEEICGVEASLAAFLEDLDERGLLERSWVVITSDHGESFGEHGVSEHGTSLYDEQVRVPLVILSPPGEGEGQALAVPEGAVGLLDIATTFAAVAGLEGGVGEGRDLRQPLAGGDVPAIGLEFFGDAAKAPYFGALAARPARAVVHWPWKLLEISGDDGAHVELYNLERDPTEAHNVAALRPWVAQRLTALLPRMGDGDEPPGQTPALTPEQEKTLRSLGYVQ